MKYNFDEVIDRSSNRSSKYDERVKKFGTADVIPLWVADMDFRTAQPIIDACKAKAEEPRESGKVVSIIDALKRSIAAEKPAARKR